MRNGGLRLRRGLKGVIRNVAESRDIAPLEERKAMQRCDYGWCKDVMAVVGKW